MLYGFMQRNRTIRCDKLASHGEIKVHSTNIRVWQKKSRTFYLQLASRDKTHGNAWAENKPVFVHHLTKGISWVVISHHGEIRDTEATTTYGSSNRQSTLNKERDMFIIQQGG